MFLFPLIAVFAFWEGNCPRNTSNLTHTKPGRATFSYFIGQISATAGSRVSDRFNRLLEKRATALDELPTLHLEQVDEFIAAYLGDPLAKVKDAVSSIERAGKVPSYAKPEYLQFLSRNSESFLSDNSQRFQVDQAHKSELRLLLYQYIHDRDTASLSEKGTPSTNMTLQIIDRKRASRIVLQTWTR